MNEASKEKSGAARPRPIQYIDSVTPKATPNVEFETHIHPDSIELYHFREGALYFVFEKERIEVEPGMMIFICSGFHHRPIIHSPCLYSRRRILLRRRALSELEAPSGELMRRIYGKGIMIISPSDVKEAGLDKLFDEAELGYEENSEYGDFCALNATVSLLIRGDRISGERQPPKFVAYHGSVMQIMEYVAEHLTDRLTYDTVAARFYLSPKNLFRIFKKETGITLYQYVLERRIAAARVILDGGASAAEAARASGFQDYTVFYRCFKKETGITPAQYISSLGTALLTGGELGMGRYVHGSERNG